MSQLGKRSVRPDAADKVTGRLVYPSDRVVSGMLHVAVVRALHPHALIRAIDTAAARALPGVVAVLTAADVPGENAFGIAIQDQPVLCTDRVRYEGDAVALVAGETLAAARTGAAAVWVDYEVLAPIVDPEAAMLRGAPALHPGGNILHQGHFAQGDVEAGFRESAVVVEQTYVLPSIEHAYLETEAGVSYYDEQGRLTVESCGQYAYRDQTQIARALGLPLEAIRVIARYTGGAFGGKDEITVQIHLALVTFKTGRPGKLVLSREESFRFSTKRHAARLHYKTGADRQGRLLALEVRAVTDTGAYASLGGPVLNVLLEHAAGPYRVPNVKIDGFAVYTNNGFAGAFRGFGCTQAAVAIESQIDLIARELGLDPLLVRERNALRQGDPAALGYEMKLAVGVGETIRSARQGPLWKARRRRKVAPRPHLRRGVGVASQMQGLGLGVGLPDYCEVALRLLPDERVELAVSTTEFGQGAYHAYALMLAERLGLPIERVRIEGGDTGSAPDSGTTTASRTTYAVGNAILLAADKLEAALKYNSRESSRGRTILGCDLGSGLAPALGGGGAFWPEGLTVRATYHMPVAERELGDGLPHILYSFGTHVALVEVDTLTGEVRVLEMEAHLDGGRVISRNAFEGQSEGGVAQGVGYALFEEVRYRDGRLETDNFHTYSLPTALDVPPIVRTVPVEVLEPTGPFGAKGIAETCMVGPTPAILNALADAIGVRFARLPVRPEDVLAACSEERRDG